MFSFFPNSPAVTFMPSGQQTQDNHLAKSVLSTLTLCTEEEEAARENTGDQKTSPNVC